MTSEIRRGEHTPGPWKLDDDLSPNRIAVRDAGGFLVCEMYAADQYQQANARLIAAAPALLEALEALTSELHKLANGNGPVRGLTLGQVKADIRLLRDHGRNAIAQAKGEEVTT